MKRAAFASLVAALALILSAPGSADAQKKKKGDDAPAENKKVKTYDWKQGQAYWLPADPPGTVHGDVNHGPDPIEVIVVELKNDLPSSNDA